MRIFNVDLVVNGPVTVSRAINFDTDKELDLGNIFRSNISIRNHPKGLNISSSVYAANKDRAYKIALLFIGKMLDVLSIKTNLALNISSNEYKQLESKNNVRAVIEEDEFRFCFELARQLNLNENKILRAFSWYRKGLCTDDPFDKFLSLWNSICVIADGYCIDNERTKHGIVNKIWDCFITIWGECPNWEFINGDDQWVNDNNIIRNNLAHGGVSVDIQYVENVINQLDTVQNVAYKFLNKWADRIGRPLE